MQLAIDGPVLPARTAAVAMAEALRAACQSRFGTRTDTSPTLSGKAPDGSLLGDHRHAHYLAMDHDDDGRIDHLAVWAPYGLEPAEVAAVAKVDRLEGAQFEQARDFARVRVAIESVASDPLQLGHIAGPAAVWRSHTPFAPSLHPKKQSQAAFLTEAVQRELDWRSSHWSRPPLLEAVEPIEPERGAWVTYRRRRVREAARRNRRAGGLQLTFREPVMGPLALGQLSHFGLGLFTPVR
jgi:CRISPR-associated protein Csb2